MSEYIDREALIAEFDRLGSGEHSLVERVFSDRVRTIVAVIPAADVAHVVHAQWIKRVNKYQCTHCKILMSIDGTPKENLLNYCPYCGAKMDEGE